MRNKAFIWIAIGLIAVGALTISSTQSNADVGKINDFFAEAADKISDFFKNWKF